MQNATTADAELILHLYELRTEERMRKARKYMQSPEFSPRSPDDVIKIESAFGSEENAYYRQVLSYWEMAATLVNNGGLDEQMFNEANGEHLFVFAKIEPILVELRQTWNQPDMLKNFELLVRRVPNNKEILEGIRERIKMIQGMMAERAAKAQTAGA